MSNKLVSRNVMWLVSLVALGGRAAAEPAPAPTRDPAPAVPPAPDAKPAAPAATPAPAATTAAPAARPDEEQDPFAFADFTWQSGSARTKDSFLGNQYFTGEFRLDDVFHDSFTHPRDDTIGGSTEAWRHAENQVTQLGIGGDFHVDRVQGRLMTQFGQLATTTPRNDASPARGQWQLADMYRYLSEAYGGYHFGDPHRGVNLQAGIFLSYVGLWSYYNYMPSQFFTLRAEFTFRHASVPYFTGSGGVTPPGGNQGAPGSVPVDMLGNPTGWKPDLVQDEPRFTLALLVKL
jgi:putative OmpL-like beta-barrel porin-2